MESPTVNGDGPVQENGGTAVWRLTPDTPLTDELEIRRLRLQGLYRDDDGGAA